MSRWWRHLALAGLVLGLLAAPHLEAPPGAVAAIALGLPGLLAVSRGRGGGASGRALALALVAGLGCLAGLLAGDARLSSLAGGALRAEPGASVAVEGVVASTPRSSRGRLRFGLESSAGRVVVTAPALEAELAVGDRVEARGRLAEPEPFRSDELARLGAALELRAGRLRVLSGGRSGLDGYLDRARSRAERAVSAGLNPGQAALARGFVLGQDDRIDEATREEFRRSGLAHLLAVSGQNVMLLAILAGVLFSLLGAGQRTRLVAVLILIAAYVPLAGSGPSIQRAGVMGAAGIIAGLAGSARDRLYLPLLAAAVTLLLNPLSAAEIGWQLSFAAVLGISLWSGPLRDVLADRLSHGPLPGRVAGPLADGAALTLTATLATAPLLALHFERVSLASLPANLLALPAVAPVMWLGMLTAMAGQLPLPGAVLAALGSLQGPLLDYIAGVATLLSRPSGAVVELAPPPPAQVALIYGCLLGAMAAGLGAARRRLGLRGPAALAALLALAAGVAALTLRPGSRSIPPPPQGALRLAALDVGQGDAILLHGPRVPPALVDTGPPGAGLPGTLRSHGIERLAAVFITHDQLDHSGALEELLGAVEVERVLLARPAPALSAIADRAGVEVELVSESTTARLGRLRLEVLSPPGDGAPAEDPNQDSIVLRASYRGRTALLTGDAEAEAVPLAPGALDALKVAHHGSADGGLDTLLAQARPTVALISVGADNPHGHPSAETLATLAERDACVLRTDRGGDVWVDLSGAGLSAGAEAQSPACPPE